ncbi:hypothetical protein OEA41_005545 [Lepraria neglecta]|uniref:Vanadium chloroperoxidase N-terminal domain-containing protein n=1 Tax=Lepraria neglecta TaxID=209136 RepID=A0AAE0DRU9_9LECA|nr:hypothetical protein OEA41_005545 [Lepraria neglecta]
MAVNTLHIDPRKEYTVSMVVLPHVDEPQEYNQNYVLYWNSVALDLNRLVVTIAGPNNGPPSAARALGILHLAIHDAYFAINPDGNFTTYLSSTEGEVKLPPTLGATDARSAVAGAANTVLMQQYATQSSNVATASTIQLAQFIQNAVTAFPNLDTLSSSYRFGIAVGNAILNLLAIKPSEPGFDQDSYRPTPGKYKFNDDPTNPIRLVPVNINDPNGPKKAVHIYQAPFYGLTAKRLAVQGSVNGASTDHVLADPPSNDPVEYYSAFDDVYREGGAQTLNTTRRTPEQTVSGFFWAYDGSNLIGTPLRLFNQIMRKIAFDKRPAGVVDEATNADFVRLFALFNASLADVGIFAWQEKYNFEFWRPLSGVREDDTPLADPFWLTLGAPETNSNQIPIKPPFPAYPSGHASFAGAGFQAARLYYKGRDNLTFADDAPDDITFDFVSEELNGVSRDLRNTYDPNIPITDQPGTIRTRVLRKFSSLWDAMHDTAISRVFLGVHWRFDAFASRDVLASTTVKQDGTTDYKASQDVRYNTLGPRADRPGLFPIGGVPLGIGVANDIFQSKLKPTPDSFQPTGRNKNGDGAAVEAAPTN